MARSQSLSEFRDNLDEIVRSIAEAPEPCIITEDGEAKAVLIDYESYEQQETLALLQLLALSKQQFREGKSRPADEVFDRLERRWATE